VSDYDPNHPPPGRWLQFLSETFEGDGERVAALPQVFGVCLDRNAVFKQLVAFQGESDCGKSVIFGVLRAMVGKRNMAAETIEKLAEDKFAMFPLWGKLVNVPGDEGFFESDDESKLKALTGEDLVKVEEKGRTPFYDVNRCKILFSCNTVPRFADRSEVMWNRLYILPFKMVVPTPTAVDGQSGGLARRFL
jgi:putative DNA primase/helicase